MGVIRVTPHSPYTPLIQTQPQWGVSSMHTPHIILTIHNIFTFTWSSHSYTINVTPNEMHVKQCISSHITTGYPLNQIVVSSLIKHWASHNSRSYKSTQPIQRVRHNSLCVPGTTYSTYPITSLKQYNRRVLLGGFDTTYSAYPAWLILRTWHNLLWVQNYIITHMQPLLGLYQYPTTHMLHQCGGLIIISAS